MPEPSLGKVLIWDVPIRVFHWLFAASCVAALALALIGDESSNLFGLHMVFGIAAAFLLIVRLTISILKGRHNRLRTMVFSPRETLAYLVGTVTGSAPRYSVHNPATSLVALVMFAFVGLLLWTGLEPDLESAGELHSILAYALIVLVAGHVLGLAVHTLRHRENIALAMVTGRKEAAATSALPGGRGGWGFVLLVFSVVWVGMLLSSYDANKQTVSLPLIGNVIQLAESETVERED